MCKKTPIFCKLHIRGFPFFDCVAERGGTYPEKVESSAHLYLIYISRQELIDLIKREGIHGVLDFGVSVIATPFRIIACNGLHFEVKNCGMRIVLKEDLEEHNNDK